MIAVFELLVPGIRPSSMIKTEVGTRLSGLFSPLGTKQVIGAPKTTSRAFRQTFPGMSRMSNALGQTADSSHRMPAFTEPAQAGRRLIRAGLNLFALCLTLAGNPAFGSDPTADLPTLGDGSSRIVSPAMEKQIGRQFLKQINAVLPTIDDPILKYYVETQIADLAQYSQLKEKVLEVVLIDSPAVNAFAAPGGVVGVNLGLLLTAEDVHEYSSVMAHELAHLSQRHFARGIEEQREAMLPTMASMIAAIAIGMAAGGDAGLAAMSASQAAAQSSQLRYSRSRETEADRIGMNTLVNAGLDPDGMARMFDRMGRAYRYSSKPPEFLLTHPLTERRVADAKTNALKYPPRQYEDSPDYTLARMRAVVHYADSPEVAVKHFRKEVADNPDSAAAQYGLALALSRAGEHDEAVPLADALFCLGARPVAVRGCLR